MCACVCLCCVISVHLLSIQIPLPLEQRRTQKFGGKPRRVPVYPVLLSYARTCIHIYYLLSQVSERTIYIVPKSTDESGRITHTHTCKYEITSRRVYSSLLYTKRSSKSIDLETFKRTFAPRVLLLILIFFCTATYCYVLQLAMHVHLILAIKFYLHTHTRLTALFPGLPW